MQEERQMEYNECFRISIISKFQAFLAIDFKWNVIIFCPLLFVFFLCLLCLLSILIDWVKPQFHQWIHTQGQPGHECSCTRKGPSIARPRHVAAETNLRSSQKISEDLRSVGVFLQHRTRRAHTHTKRWMSKCPFMESYILHSEYLNTLSCAVKFLSLWATTTSCHFRPLPWNKRASSTLSTSLTCTQDESNGVPPNDKDVLLNQKISIQI